MRLQGLIQFDETFPLCCPLPPGSDADMTGCPGVSVWMGGVWQPNKSYEPRFLIWTLVCNKNQWYLHRLSMVLTLWLIGAFWELELEAQAGSWEAGIIVIEG